MAARRQLFECSESAFSLVFEDGVPFDISSDFDDTDKDPDYVPVQDSIRNSNNSSENIISKALSAVNTETSFTESQCKKRKKRMSKQKEIQFKLNNGKSYRRKRGKGDEIGEKVIGSNCNCQMQCFKETSDEDRKTIFNNFWIMGNYNLQNAYLHGCIETKPVKRLTKKTNSPSRRSSSCVYYVNTSDGKHQKVCKNAFLNIHGLQNNRGRVERIAQNKSKGGVTPSLDKRGTHNMHPRKYTEEDIITVKVFIGKLPKYESHYSRNENPNKLFMTMEYTIESCYQHYKEDCININCTYVSSDKFRRIFNEDFNISFRKPKTDTCNVCDALHISIMDAKNQKNEEQRQKLLQQQKLHHLKAKAGQNSITDATKEAQNQNDLVVITFDLEQALPTPKMSTGPTFYKRKLFCYNFSIHSCSDNQGYFYMWDENTGGRGADEIASCILKHFELHDIRGKTLIAFSDNCTGQNKNWTIVGVWLRLLAIKRFKKIVHMFPQVGHTMLPSDRDFALVEKHVRAHCQYVYSPAEWITVLENCQKKKPFQVYQMESEDFLRVSHMRQYFRQPAATASTVSIRDAVRMELSSDNFSELKISDTYNGSLYSVSLKKQGRPTDFISPFLGVIPVKSAVPLGIEQGKLADVLSCLQWIPPVHHKYYTDLKPREIL